MRRSTAIKTNLLHLEFKRPDLLGLPLQYHQAELANRVDLQWWAQNYAPHALGPTKGREGDFDTSKLGAHFKLDLEICLLEQARLVL